MAGEVVGEYILLANIEGEEESRVCGRTSSKEVATAWSIGDGHQVYTIPLDGKLKASGYEALDLSEEEVDEGK